MPWPSRLRRGAGPSIALVALPLALVGCVTVATAPAAPPTFPPATPGMAAASAPASAPAVTVEPVATAAAVPGVTTEPVPGVVPGVTTEPEATAETAASTEPATSEETATSTEPPVGSAVPAVGEDPEAAALVATSSASPGAVAGEAAVLTPTPIPTFRPTAPPTPLPSPAEMPTAAAVASPLVEPAASAATAGEPSRGRAVTLDAATRRRLQAILANHVSNRGVAGLQAAVRLPSGETWLGSAGNAQFSPDRAIADDTQFSIASVTKTFVAALVLQLVDEGRIDLDAPFGTYFDDAPRSKTVTVRQLLSHTSGIYNYFANPRYGKAAAAWLRASPTGLDSREHRWTYDEIMGLVKSGYCKPGECYSYSNTNYVILGKVAEAVGGAPIHQQLRQRFFRPLGLEDTVYQPAQRPSAGAAHGHWNWGGGYSDHTRDARVLPFMAAVTVADAAGAIASTARDLSVWADALYGGQLLSASSLREMTTILREGTYGLGTDVAYFAGHRGYGHRGGLRGFESSMWYFPDTGVSVVLLSNQGNWLTDVPMGKLVKAVLGKA